MDVHVSNQSTIFITLPDLFENPNDVIDFDISDSRAEIEATCTAYGGKPDPEFHWYVGDTDNGNEITDFNSQQLMTSSDDLGDYVEQRIQWTPSREDLCKFD